MSLKTVFNLLRTWSLKGKNVNSNLYDLWEQLWNWVQQCPQGLWCRGSAWQLQAAMFFSLLLLLAKPRASWKLGSQSTTELYSQPLKHFLMIYPLPDAICSMTIPRDGIKTEEVSFPAHSWALHRLGHNTEIAALWGRLGNGHSNWLGYFSFGETAQSFRGVLCPISVSDETDNLSPPLQRRASVPTNTHAPDEDSSRCQRLPRCLRPEDLSPGLQLVCSARKWNTGTQVHWISSAKQRDLQTWWCLRG